MYGTGRRGWCVWCPRSHVLTRDAPQVVAGGCRNLVPALCDLFLFYRLTLTCETGCWVSRERECWIDVARVVVLAVFLYGADGVVPTVPACFASERGRGGESSLDRKRQPLRKYYPEYSIGRGSHQRSGGLSLALYRAPYFGTCP